MFMNEDDTLLDVARRESACLHDHGLFDASIALDELIKQRAELLEALKELVIRAEANGWGTKQARAAITRVEAAE